MKRFVVFIAGTFIATGLYFGGAKPYSPTVPGVLNPGVTQETIGQTICVPGWTKTIRPRGSYTTGIKLDYCAKKKCAIEDFELDHAISLVLGGAPADPDNLWMQKYPEARYKDRVENHLHRQVCNGEITLKEAQKKVLNWYPVHQSFQGFGGAVGLSDISDLIDLDDN